MDVTEPSPGTLAEQLGETYVSARDDLEISRHVFFGETSYVVRDPITFEGHNLSPSDYEIFTNLSDNRSLSEIVQDLIERKILDESEQEDFYRYVVELQKRNLLSLPVTDGESLFQQFEQRSRAGSKNLLMKLLFIKVPLGCPDRFLKSTYHLARGFFSWQFFVVWLIGLFSALALIGFHWTEFTSDLSSALALQNLPMILVVMSVLKLWHEMGHGYACRHFGVSVPSAGVLFMVGTPLAFVDATGSWSLPRRIHRQIINLGGMYFEMMFAIIAAYVWVFVDNAFIKSIAHFTLLISSVTTIAFNINPLMKYDGYFVLADWLGIPNLKTRSAYIVQLLSKKIFFGLNMPPAESFSLRAVLISYGVAAGLYRISLTIGIAILISTQIWIIGLMLGAYYMAASFGSMALKIFRYLAWSEEIQHKRRLAIGYLILLFVGIPAAILFCPVPGRAQARGVAESGTLNVVHLEHGGFLENLSVVDGQIIERGAVLGQIENIEKNNEQMLKRARLQGLQVKYRRYRGQDIEQAAKTEKEINQIEFELASTGIISSIARIQAPISGVVIAREDEVLPGDYLEPGEELLRIGSPGWSVRAVANASSLADIKPYVGQQVHCRFVANSGIQFPGTIESVSPSGDRVVHHKALTHLAGGFIPVTEDSMEATEPFFELQIRLNDHPGQQVLRNGLVCEVRFRNTWHTVGEQLYRAILRFTNRVNMS